MNITLLGFNAKGFLEVIQYFENFYMAHRVASEKSKNCIQEIIVYESYINNENPYWQLKELQRINSNIFYSKIHHYLGGKKIPN